MASQLKKTRTITDKISVNGELNDNGTEITYLNEDKDDEVISITDCLKPFYGKSINFSISVKSEDDLPED